MKQCGSVVRISNVVASLTDVAAGALNATLDTDLFAGGLTLGVATVKVRMPAEGQTMLFLDQPISQALAGNAIMVMPIKTGETWPLMPVWMNAAEGYLEEGFSFPITGTTSRCRALPAGSGTEAVCASTTPPTGAT